MSAPTEFLKEFTASLEEARVGYAITSGKACVFYGLQQTTKDTDFIIELADLQGLCDLLESFERRMPPWRVSYRIIFGAPLVRDFMAHGWSSHLC